MAPWDACPTLRYGDNHSHEGDVLAVPGNHCVSSDREAEHSWRISPGVR